MYQIYQIVNILYFDNIFIFHLLLFVIIFFFFTSNDFIRTNLY